MENIQMLQSFKKKNKSRTLIKGHITIVKENLNEIPMFIDLYNSFGFDVARFGYENSVKEYLGNNIGLKKKLKKVINRRFPYKFLYFPITQ